MLGWFIKRSPFAYLRLVLGFVVLFILILKVNTLPIGQSELAGRLVAESLAGGQRLYSDVKTNLAPLSAGFYRLFFSVAADKRLFGQLLALGLLLLQAYFFNAILEKLKTFSESNRLPLLYYLLFSQLTFDLYHVSPFLLGQTCFLGALWLVSSLPPKPNYNFVYVGVVMAGAALFHQIFLLFNLFLVWYIFAESKNQALAKLIFLGYGLLGPWLAVGLYFTAFGSAIDFLEQYFYVYDYSKYIDYDLNKIYLAGGLGGLAILVLMNLLTGGRLRSKNLYFGLLSVLIGLGFFIFRGIFTPAYFLLLALPFGYYATAILLSFRKKLGRFLAFCSSLVLILGFAYYNHNSIFNSDLNRKSNFIMQPKTTFAKDSILVLGDDVNYYLNNHLAGGFLDWRLAQACFQNLDQPSNLVAIDKQLSEQKPRIIIDLEAYMPQVLKRLPHLKYRRENTIYYIRID